MEDWLNWTIYFSPVVLGDVLELSCPQMAQAWRHIRLAVIYYTKGSVMHSSLTQHDKDSASLAASKHLWDAAVILQTVCPMSMCTLNLRLVVVYSRMQEQHTGAIWTTVEMWIERMIQHLKSNTVMETLHMPEIVTGNEYLLKLRLEELSREVSDVQTHVHTMLQGIRVASCLGERSGTPDDESLVTYLQCKVPTPRTSSGAYLHFVVLEFNCLQPLQNDSFTLNPHSMP
jgi:hypothetical protein